MSTTEMRVSRLRRLHERWLQVAEKFELVTHCCATQESPVHITARSTDGAEVNLGDLRSQIYTAAFVNSWDGLDLNTAGLREIVFQGRDGEREFRTWLHRGTWGSVAVRALSPLDRVSSYYDVDIQAGRMPHLQDARDWFGYFVFEHSWDEEGTSGSTSWFEAVAPLAAESLATSGITIPASPGRYFHDSLAPWLAIVYEVLEVEPEPVREVTNDLVWVHGAVVQPENVRLKGQGTATVSSAWSWLPCDFPTASAMAIEQLADRYNQGGTSVIRENASDRSNASQSEDDEDIRSPESGRLLSELPPEYQDSDGEPINAKRVAFPLGVNISTVSTKEPWYFTSPPPNVGTDWIGPIDGGPEKFVVWLKKADVKCSLRSLHSRNGIGTWYVQKIHKRSWKMWLSSQSLYAKVNSAKIS